MKTEKYLWIISYNQLKGHDFMQAVILLEFCYNHQQWAQNALTKILLQQP